MIRHWWRGSGNDDLIKTNNGSAKGLEAEASANVHSVTHELRKRITEVVNLRPVHFPWGAAARRRQQGVELIPRLTQNINARMIEIAKGGEIQTGDVENVSP